MKSPKILAGVLLAMILAIASSVVMVRSAYAQCGLVGTVPCAPAPSGGSDGEKQRRPTKTPSATPIPTATPTATLKVSVLMPLGGGDAALTATFAAIQTYTAQTQMALTPSATSTPSPLTRPIITPVAGPIIPPFGSLGMIIAVLVPLGAGALIIIVRSQLGGAGSRPPNPDLSDGTIRFDKASPMPSDGAFRFDKDFQFDKDFPGGDSAGSEAGQDLNTRFMKWTPGDSESGPGSSPMGDGSA